MQFNSTLREKPYRGSHQTGCHCEKFWLHLWFAR